MASVTFPEALGGNGQTYTDDADPNTGLDGLGYTIRFIPCLQQAVAMGLSAKNDAHAADGFVQQCQTLRQETATDRQAVAEDRAAVEQHLQDAQARIGTTQALIDARDTALAAQAGAEDAETGAVAAQTSAEAARDAAVVSGQVYPDTSAGLTATSDGQYFKTVAANQAGFLTLWRNNAGVATEIETYPSLTGIAQALEQANRKQTRLARSLQRLGDHGQTLHSDFNLAAYGLGTPLYGGVQDAVEGEELWNGFERLSGTLAYQHTADGSLKYVYVPPNVLAREYNPETGQYQAQDYGALRNELLWSTVFSNAAWNESQLSVSPASVSSPLGSAYKLTENAAETIGHAITQNINAIPDAKYCVSVIVKRSERTWVALRADGAGVANSGSVTYFDILNGTVGYLGVEHSDAKAKHIGAGWYLCSVIIPSSASGGVFSQRVHIAAGDGLQVYTGDGTSGIYIAHAQLVEGSTPGPVIVTEGAPVTRAADNIKRVFQEDFNGVEGTFIIECEIDASETTQTLYFLGDSDNNRIAQYYSKSDGAMLNRVAASGMPYNPPSIPVLAGKIRAGVTFKNGLAIFGANGTTVSSMPAALPNITQAILGKNAVNSFYLNGAVRLVKAIPKAVSEPEFQHLVSLEVSQ